MNCRIAVLQTAVLATSPRSLNFENKDRLPCYKEVLDTFLDTDYKTRYNSPHRNYCGKSHPLLSNILVRNLNHVRCNRNRNLYATSVILDDVLIVAEKFWWRIGESNSYFLRAKQMCSLYH